MHKVLTFLGLFAVLGFAGLPALAGDNSSHITVNGVQRYFMVGKSPVQNIEVTNRSDRVMMLKTVVEKRLNPGGHVGEFAEMDNTFLFAPKRFTLKPHETRMVRMVRSAQHDDEEHVYRVAFLPTKEMLKAEEKQAAIDRVDFGVKMVLTTGMLVLVSPRTIKEDLSFVRDIDGITFTNNGNISIDMRRAMSRCYKRTSGEDLCMGLPGKRIYPGKSWRLAIDGDVDFDYHYMVYNKHSRNSPVSLKPAF